MNILNNEDYLKIASVYSGLTSGCTKVQVGSLITRDNRVIAMGANRAIPNLCKTRRGCLRVEKYGDNFKTHRDPADCRAIHSEIDAICHSTENLYGATIYVTRYPCEGCARAIVSAGIKLVVYGREQEISEETQAIFLDAGVDIYHLRSYKEQDNGL